MRLCTLFLAFPLFILLSSCQHDGETYNPTTDTSAIGTIYFQGPDSIVGLDIKTSSIKFKARCFDNFGSYFTFMGHDSGYLYKSTGQYYMVSYNTTNGTWLWNYRYYLGTISGSGGLGVRAQKMIFVDTTMLFVQSFLGYGTSLYCLNKKTGTRIWRQLICPGTSTISDYAPVISGDRVIVGGNNITGAEIIICFDRISGQKLWEYTMTQPSTNKFEIHNGTVISLGKKITCLNISDGSLRWEVTPTSTGVANSVDYFNESDKTLILRSLSSSMECYWLNKSDGTITQGPSFTQPYARCIYANNKIYFLHNQGPAEITVKAFNILSGTALWTCTLPGPYGVRGQSDYFTQMLMTDDRIIFGENVNRSPDKRSKFNIIDPVTGNLQELFTSLSIMKYFVVVKQDKTYTPEY